jgi:hypothetical protein
VRDNGDDRAIFLHRGFYARRLALERFDDLFDTRESFFVVVGFHHDEDSIDA